MDSFTPLFSDESPFIKKDSRTKRWAIPYHSDCLNARVERLLFQQQDLISGCGVMDIASHIGTMSYAAHSLGAKFIHGVETEQELVNTALNLFKEHGVAEPRFKFETGDVFKFLESCEENSFDTILCFGMLYYTAEPYRLLKLMFRAAKQGVLIDTFTAAYAAIQGKDAARFYPEVTDELLKLPILLTSLTQSSKKDYTLPQGFPYKDKDVSLTSFPTQSLLELWMQSLGVTYHVIDWSDHATRPCTWRDLLTPEQKKSSHWADVYTSGVRVSYRITP